MEGTPMKKLKTMFDLDHLHRLYLVIAVFIGLMLAFFMPLFNEPDGQYHYTYATNIAGLSNDLSKYGESVGSGMISQVPSYQAGNHFETYYEMPITRIPISKLPRGNSLPPLTSFNYWGHVIPALGVFLGYQIYPSLGVMITVGRLFDMLIFSLAMFFIIRSLRRGKLLFVAFGLSPVFLNQITSLSYDGTSFILVSLSVALAINLIDRHKVTGRDFIKMLLVTFLLIFAAKTNFVYLVILFPLVWLGIWWRNRELRSINLKSLGRKLFRSGPLVLLGFALLLLALAIIASRAGGYAFIHQLFFNITINPNTNGLNPGNLFLSFLASPYPNYNYTPFWLAGAWLLLIVLILLFEERYVASPFISFGALGLFILIAVGTFFGFVNYTVNGAVSNGVALGQIVGLQGRYFTPLLLLLGIFAGYQKFKLKLKRQNILVVATLILSIVSSALLLYGTLFGMYYL
jgi:hypothetical protein